MKRFSKTTVGIALCTFGIILPGSPAAAQQVRPADDGVPMVYAGLVDLRLDGSIGGSAAKTATNVGDLLSGALYLAPCSSMGSASPSSPVSASATDVWSLSGAVIALSETEASVQLTWQRMRSGGQDVVSPPQSTTLTLRRGERSRLETITLPARGTCPARLAALDLAFGTRTEVTGVATGGGGGRGGASGGGGQGQTPSRGQGGEAVRGVSAIGSRLEGGAVARVPSDLNADLWLVQSSPGTTDHTLHTTSPVWSAPRRFAFAPVVIRTTAGVFTVTVQGTVETGLSPEGEPRFFFSADRTVRFAPAIGPARDAPPVVEGSTKTAVALPRPEEVLSFELPPIRSPNGSMLPDRLSVRVRLTPNPGRAAPR